MLHPVASRADFENAAEAYRRNDFVTAFEAFKPLAEHDDARAQTVLALMYKYGEGVDKDLATALAWYLRAAELNYAPAQFHAGVMLADGLGTEPDEERAALWLARAAESGFERANDKLAELDMTQVTSSRHVDKFVPWSQNWNLQLPNEIRFAADAPVMSAQPGFRVQLGAMSSRENARRLQGSLQEAQPELFDGIRFGVIDPVGERAIFRLQAGPFASIEAARFFCDQVLRREITTGCLPLHASP